MSRQVAEARRATDGQSGDEDSGVQGDDEGDKRDGGNDQLDLLGGFPLGRGNRVVVAHLEVFLIDLSGGDKGRLFLNFVHCDGGLGVVRVVGLDRIGAHDVVFGDGVGFEQWIAFARDCKKVEDDKGSDEGAKVGPVVFCWWHDDIGLPEADSENLCRAGGAMLAST